MLGLLYLFFLHNCCVFCLQPMGKQPVHNSIFISFSMSRSSVSSRLNSMRLVSVIFDGLCCFILPISVLFGQIGAYCAGSISVFFRPYCNLIFIYGVCLASYILERNSQCTYRIPLCHDSAQWYAVSPCLLLQCVVHSILQWV